MVFVLKRIWRIIVELVKIKTKMNPTQEDHENARLLSIDLSMIFFQIFGELLIWFIIAYYFIFFLNAYRYCAWQDDFSLEAFQRYVKYEFMQIDPIEEQRALEQEKQRLAHEILREKHRQAAEVYRQVELEGKQYMAELAKQRAAEAAELAKQQAAEAAELAKQKPPIK